jgi:hypothetical protein
MEDHGREMHYPTLPPLTEGERLAQEIEARRHYGWPSWAISLERQLTDIQHSLDKLHGRR